jgi:hypothetical protein
MLPNQGTLDVPLVFQDGLSQPVPLPGSGLAAVVPEAAPPGGGWQVTARAVPAVDLGALTAQLAALGGDWELALFGVGITGDYARYRAIWQSDLPLPYRLSAVLLALALRTDAARTQEVDDAG